MQRPFDLAAGICVRYKLFRIDSLNHLLSVTMHHITTDAWSLGVYVSELSRAYEAYRSGQQDAPLPPLQVEYSDYAQWQRANLRGLRLNKLLNYWTDRLAGAPHVLKLPTSGFATVDANMHHFAIAKGRTIVQVNSMGPFVLTYVNPADDPSQKPKTSAGIRE